MNIRMIHAHFEGVLSIQGCRAKLDIYLTIYNDLRHLTWLGLKKLRLVWGTHFWICLYFLHSFRVIIICREGTTLL